jgi:hypothetical protein
MRRLPACFHDKNQDKSFEIQGLPAIHLTEVKARPAISR